MTSLTLFSAPKPFTDPHVAAIQRNAIRSWMLLPDVEVILLGEETGLAGAAQELGVRHIPNVARNANGTPLVSSMLQLARENGRGDLLCLINTDMLLMSDFIEAARQVAGQKSNFVLLSQRWDLDVTQPLEFGEGWQTRLRARVKQDGQLHKPAGSDFFLFPRSAYLDLPDFAVGRAGWDNWMIYKARKEGWPVIDCTPSAMIVHQNHDYAHLPGGRSHHTTLEADQNIRLAGGQAAIRYTILDSTHQLVDGKLVRPKMTRPRLLRRLELLLRKVFFFLPEQTLETVARPKRWKKRIQRFIKK
ncbi:MAG: glycosyltransferase [Chloroflexota bacterium]